MENLRYRGNSYLVTLVRAPWKTCQKPRELLLPPDGMMAARLQFVS